MKERHSGLPKEPVNPGEFATKKFFTSQQLGIRTYGNITIRKTAENVTVCVSKKLATSSKITVEELENSTEMKEIFEGYPLNVEFEITENHKSLGNKLPVDELGRSQGYTSTDSE